MRRKRTTAEGDTRAVIVRVFATQRVTYRGDIVLTVPAGLTEDEIEEIVWNDADNLPHPACWEAMGGDEDLEISTEMSPLVLCNARLPEDTVARLFVDEDGNGEIVT